MKSLLKIVLIIALCFAATFIVVKTTGILTLAQIEGWLKAASTVSLVYLALIVICILIADIFIAVPTLTVTILAGYFLGYFYGAISVISGLLLAGLCGYGLSRYFGDSILRFLLKDEHKRTEAITSFQRHGFVMILLARAVPILPEVTACLAGMTRMSLLKFLSAWSVSAIPYALIATYSGSISSLEDPKPAIAAAVGISGFLWISWYLLARRINRNEPAVSRVSETN